jgi:hypothetical protein
MVRLSNTHEESARTDGRTRGSTFPQVAAFGAFRLRVTERLLEKDGIPVKIGSRAIDILLTLVERAPNLVIKRDLISRVWGNLVIDESSLRWHIASRSLRSLVDFNPIKGTEICQRCRCGRLIDIVDVERYRGLIARLTHRRADAAYEWDGGIGLTVKEKPWDRGSKGLRIGHTHRVSLLTAYDRHIHRNGLESLLSPVRRDYDRLNLVGSVDGPYAAGTQAEREPETRPAVDTREPIELLDSSRAMALGANAGADVIHRDRSWKPEI